jgi:5,10-methylenetetrahydromethanopterin reductase
MPDVRMALYMQDKHPISYELEMARYAEERGFSEIWQADSSLARDAVVLMSLFLANTRRLKIGSGILPIWTRNPAVIAATWSTMYEFAPRRLMLGLGAWFEPLASSVGVNRRKPLAAMREYVEAIRQLFTMERVTYHGEFVRFTEAQLDIVHQDRSPREIPIHIGATGDKMLQLAGEIADGVLLNYVVSPEYVRRAVKLVEEGAARSRRTLDQIDRPELIVCSLSEDRKAAIDAARELVAYYFGYEPHIMKASGVSQDLLDALAKVLTWPRSKEKLQKAKDLIPDETVQLLCAAGTPEECRAKVAEYVAAGCTCPVLYPLMNDIRPVIDTFAEGL